MTFRIERASQVQFLASLSGQPFSSPLDEELLAKRSKIYSPQHLQNVWNYYCRTIGPL